MPEHIPQGTIWKKNASKETISLAHNLKSVRTQVILCSCKILRAKFAYQAQFEVYITFIDNLLKYVVRKPNFKKNGVSNK
jgi:hypothetical protein